MRRVRIQAQNGERIEIGRGHVLNQKIKIKIETKLKKNKIKKRQNVESETECKKQT